MEGEEILPRRWREQELALQRASEQRQKVSMVRKTRMFAADRR